MNKAVLMLLLCFSAAISFAQQDTIRLKNTEPSKKTYITDRAPQAVYFQLGGSGPIMSVNYDRRFSKKLGGAGFAAGVGFWGVTGISIFSVPVSLNYLFGKKSNFIEVAAGATYISATAFDFYNNENNSGSGFLYHANLGYRYQPSNGGFFFRGGLSPLFAQDVYVTSYYLGFGHNF